MGGRRRRSVGIDYRRQTWTSRKRLSIAVVVVVVIVVDNTAIVVAVVIRWRMT